MRVDHNKYRLFIYDNHPSENFQLGDVVTKITEDGTEIGVIIQTHDNGDCRTDMFGNCSLDEITLSTRGEVERYRPELLPDIDGTSETISVQGKFANLLELSNGDLRISINKAGEDMFQKQLDEKLNRNDAFHYILGDILEYLGMKFCKTKQLGNKPMVTSAHQIAKVGGKLKWVETGHGKWWEYDRVPDFTKYLLMDKEVTFRLNNQTKQPA